MMTNTQWYDIETDEVLCLLDATDDGLTSIEAERRLTVTGPNILPDKSQRPLLLLLLNQFSDFMILVLLAASLVSSIIGEVQDTIAILIIVLLNAMIGATQEYRAERAVAALRKMASTEARVLRDGTIVSMDSTLLVPGDIVFLESGNVVPADLRLLETEGLQANESALTGESLAVNKQHTVLAGNELPVGDRLNLAFKDSLITHGSGKGIVVATGLNTETGRIAALLGTESRVKTPLQIRLARFGRRLAVAILAICAVVFTAGLLQGQPALLMLLTAVSLAVAAIPEALPAVVTVSLALGAGKLARHNALVRHLPAVETLGSVTFICADKTGTLTQNHMSVEWLFFDNDRHPCPPLPASDSQWTELGIAMAISNDIIEKDSIPSGDATELAIFEAARQAGYDKTQLQQGLPRIAAIPFDSKRKQMTSIHQHDKGVVAYCKGAPECILSQCSHTVAEAEFDRDNILVQAERLASEGYRVLAFAKHDLDNNPDIDSAETIESDLCFLGLVAMMDPPRPEVAQALLDCSDAGIAAVMITGDHPGTATAIARRLGIISNTGELTLTGNDVKQMDDDALASVVKHTRVYARVSSEQKLRIIKALQANGEFVAMTGDGVNDAPALKRAGIGMAMGKKGTDVAREAADMVLLDDNFATIVSAVRIGRRIYDNIRKFIKDTMSSNSGEIWTLFLAPFLGLPIPLLPIHILWINLITDGLPGLAFSAEPAEQGSMNRPPRSPTESIFARGMWQHILWVGFFVAAISIAAQAWAISNDKAYWQTVVFTVLTFSQLFHSLAVRSEKESLFHIGILSNPAMLTAISIAFTLHIAVIYVPLLNTLFHTEPLPAMDLFLCVLLSSMTLLAVEIEKWLIRKNVLYNSA